MVKTRPKEPPRPRRRERFAQVLFVRLTDAARAVGVSEAALREDILAGRLEARRRGRAVLIAPDDLRRWAENLPAA